MYSKNNSDSKKTYKAQDRACGLLRMKGICKDGEKKKQI